MEIFTFSPVFATTLWDMERLPAAIAAFMLVIVAGLVAGGVAGRVNPPFWTVLDFLFGGLGGRLDNTDRPKRDLTVRGSLVLVVVVCVALFLGFMFQSLSRDYKTYNLIDIVALSLVLSAGAGWKALFRLYQALNSQKTIRGAFYSLAASSRTNLIQADEYTITRVGIGMVTRLMDKAVCAPLFWYLLLGLPAVFVYAATAGLAWRFGKDGYSKGFGRPAVWLEKMLGFVPSALCGLYVALAAILTPTAGMFAAMRGLLAGFDSRAPYAEGGAPVTAMAYALGISLGGAGQDLDGSALPRRWVGPKNASAKLSAHHLYRALYLIVLAHILVLLTLLFMVLIHGHSDVLVLVGL